jgi:hypothetical protein
MTGHDGAAGADPPRDPVLDRAYAAGANEEPPARLDAAILAAARREAGAGPRRLGSAVRAWRGPMALAAVLVLSVSVVLLLREEGADRLDQLPPSAAPPAPDSNRYSEPAASAKLESAPGVTAGDVVPQIRDAPAQPPPAAMRGPPAAAEAPPPALRPFVEPPPAPAELRAAPAAPPSQAGSLAKETDSGPAAGARDRAATMERELQAQRAPVPKAESAPASSPPGETPAPPAVAAAPDAATGLLGRSQAPPRRALPDSANRMEQRPRDDIAAVAPRPAWQGFERQPPEKWLERVEELRRAGRGEEAREMLVEFRRRFPQHPVPPFLDR